MLRPARPAALSLSALLAACQPLPHPFADDRPRAELLRVPDTASVSVAPVEGKPEAIAAKLGAATAGALLKRDIPASAKSAGRSSYQLYGKIAEAGRRGGKSVVTVAWRLDDAKGQTVGEQEAKLEAKADEVHSASDAVVARLATLSADAVAPLLTDQSPVPAAASAKEDRRVQVAVRKVSGAPGDGGTSLTTAISAVLRRQNVAVVDAAAKADLYVEGEVDVAPVKPDKQHVTIVWRVRRADGTEIGKVGLDNDVPRGLLNGAWGDIAYTVAMAASEGLLQLLARGASAPKP